MAKKEADYSTYKEAIKTNTGTVSYEDALKEFMSQFPGLLQQNAQAQVDAQRNAFGGQADVAQNLLSNFDSQQQAYLPIFQDLLSKYSSALQKQSDTDTAAQLQTVLALTPQLNQIRNANEDPLVTQMRGNLLSQAAGELAKGQTLDAKDRLGIEKTVRAGQIARGIGGGQGEANAESVAKNLEGMKLQTQRQQNAMGIMNNEQAGAVNPFATILGMPTVTANAQQTSQNGIATPTMVGGPMDVFGTGYNTALLGQSQQTISQDQQRYLLQKLLAEGQASEFGIKGIL